MLLWLGSFMVGIEEKVFLCLRVGLRSCIKPSTGAWVDACFTFFKAPPSRRCGRSDNKSISRTNECRLLWQTAAVHFSELPLRPWRPFSTTLLCEIEIEVCRHAHCLGHCFRYSSWQWDVDGAE